MPVNKVLKAGMFTKDAIENSNIITPDVTWETQYKKDQAKCV